MRKKTSGKAVVYESGMDYDKAHKLAADRVDLQVRKTDRYRLAEALAGIQSEEERWALSWRGYHFKHPEL